MKKAIQLAVIVLLFWLYAMTVIAQVESYTLHTSSNIDEISVAAVNSKTGDILVVWAEYIISSSNQRLWAATLKREANGSYAVGKAVALTPEGSYAHNPAVAFSELKSRFLIVYGVGKFPVRVESRLVKKTKIASKSRVLFEDKSAGFGFKMVLAGVVKKSQLPSRKAQFVLVRNIQDNIFGDDSGLYLVMLNKKGMVTGDPFMLRNYDYSDGYTSAGHTTDIEVSGSGSIYIALHWNTESTGGDIVIYPGILAVDAEGNPVDTVAAGSTTSYLYPPKIALLKSGEVLCSWHDGDDNAIYNQRFRPNLRLLGASYKSLSVEQLDYDFGLVSDDDGIAYQYTEKGGTGVLYRLKPAGNGLDTKENIDVPSASASQYTMVNIPGRNQLLLVTDSSIDGNKTAMLAHVISLDEVFN